MIGSEQPANRTRRPKGPTFLDNTFSCLFEGQLMKFLFIYNRERQKDKRYCQVEWLETQR